MNPEVYENEDLRDDLPLNMADEEDFDEEDLEDEIDDDEEDLEDEIDDEDDEDDED